MSDETEKWQKISGLSLSLPSELSHMAEASLLDPIFTVSGTLCNIYH
jgi:hypothetical protein